MIQEWQLEIIKEVWVIENEEALGQIMEEKFTIRSSPVFILNGAQKRSIEISEKQIQNGVTVSLEEAMRNMNEWLNKQ